MSWSLMRMARYVQKVKLLQQLKESEEICSRSMEKGSYLLFCEDRPFLLRREAGVKSFKDGINWRSFKDVEFFNPNVKQTSIVLDVDENVDEMTPLFACSVPSEVIDDVQTKFNGIFSDMRRALFSLRDAENQLVSRGYSMITWNENVKFCCYCGSHLDRKMSGCSKVCSQKCNSRSMTHYPQIHPVAIIRVTSHLNDKILLVRQPQLPQGMYTCIAGFMEPGEVLNDNIRREIAEESGIVVQNVQYFQSQAWPLPQTSLMLACTAVAMPGSEKIVIDKEELEDGRWFSKEEVVAALNRVKGNPKSLLDNEDGKLLVPPHGAIAHQLIQNWVDQYAPAHL